LREWGGAGGLVASEALAWSVSERPLEQDRVERQVAALARDPDQRERDRDVGDVHSRGPAADSLWFGRELE
jgi:hypothetical protein